MLEPGTHLGPDAFAADKERLARFEREAKLLASLNHAGIATLYEVGEDDGVHFIVMELVPGETLEERIRSGPIPIDEALALFQHIAEALGAAHEKGVIHRDLKPPNIKITEDGDIKILDFGLAKAFIPDKEMSPDSSLSRTLTKAGTQVGTILGTASYMPVTKRCSLTVSMRRRSSSSVHRCHSSKTSGTAAGSGARASRSPTTGCWFTSRDAPAPAES